MSDRLAEYRGRRDLDASGEPGGRARGARGGPRFVIQKHAASTLHYDLRLEVGGTLRSWAVPKGPSTDPRERRLAIQTEDHPLEYADFEGVIPEGHYGAGAVIVWDAGALENRSRHDGAEISLEDALERGHATVWLEGEKISGGYSLTRMRRSDSGDQWLLAKVDDERADARRNPVSTQQESVLSGRRVEDLEPGDR